MKVTKDIKVFDPRHGKGLVIEITHNVKYPILVCFEAGDYSYTEYGAYAIQNKTLAFNDYTGNEAADWVTLERIKEMLEPQHPVEGKLYKCWDDDNTKGTYYVAKCVNHENSAFTLLDCRPINFDHFEPIETEDYNS